MFQRLFIFSISASLLFSIPAIADRHHHEHLHDKIEKEKEKNEKLADKLAEVKAKEKTGSEKVVGGLLQFVNKTAPLWALVIAGIVVWSGPCFFGAKSHNSDEKLLGKAIEGIGSFVISWQTLKHGTAAAMAQENIKELKK